MKCAMSLKMKLTAYPFHFFVNAPPQKKKQQTQTKPKPQRNHPLSPPPQPPSTLRILSLVRFQLQGLGFR